MKKSLSPRLAAILLFTVSSLSTLVFWNVAVRNDVRGFRSASLATARGVNELIVERMSEARLALTRMGIRLETGIEDREELWLKDAQAYLSHFPGIEAMAVTDANNVVKWYKTKKPTNIRFKGLQLAFEPVRAEALVKARESRTTTYSRTLQLKTGGTGFYSVTPLFRGDRYIGALIAVLTPEGLISAAHVQNVHLIRLYDQSGVPLTQNELPPDTALATWAVDTQLTIDPLHWKLSLTPTQATLADKSSRLPTIILVSGLLFSLLLAFLIHSMLTSKRQQEHLNKTQKALHESERRLTYALEGSSDGIWDWDLVGEEIYVSKKLANYFGGPQTISTKSSANFSITIHPDDIQRTNESIGRHLGGASVLHEAEARLKSAWGEWRWFLTRGKVSERGPNGEPLRMTGVHIDIQHQKEVEAELEASKKQAIEATQSKGQFLANMSHEIRTPLNGILGFADLLLETPLDAEQANYMQIVRDSGTTLLALINDILDLSKIETGKLSIETLSFSLVSLVESHVEMLSIKAKQKNIDLHTFISPEIPALVLGDSGRIGQIILNLLGNALKFTDKGSVTIRVEPIASAVRFEIRDSGIGIPPEVISKLFQPFTQANGSTARKYGGTGLGLSICKQLVELMNGEIGVDSTPGVGSTFWFTLPLEADLTHGDQSQKSRALAESVRGARILVYEPLAFDRLTVIAYLESWKFKVFACEDFEEFQKTIRENTFDLALLGDANHFADSVELAKKQRIVYLSDWKAAADLARLFKEPALIVSKPTKQSELLDRIVTALVPTARAAKPARAQAAPVLETHYRILVAEDVPANQLLILKLLEKAGYYGKAVANGQEVITEISRAPYDLVLMDVHMPEMDGYEATRRIRTLDSAELRAIPIVALTANALSGDDQTCIAAGMNDYLSKPVLMPALRAMLTKWLPQDKKTAA